MLDSTTGPALPLRLTSTNFSKHLDLDIPKQRQRIVSEAQTEGSRNSSLGQIWAEDYYSRDSDLTCEGNSDSFALPSPPATAHTSPQSFCKDESPTRRPRAITQRSLTSFLPAIISPKSKSRSPERRERSKNRSKSPSKTKRKGSSVEGEEGFMPTLTGDKEGVIKIEDRSRGLASWFTGSSAAVQVGIPGSAMSSEDFSPRDITPKDLDVSPSPGQGKLRKRATVGSSTDSTNSISTTPTPKAATSSWRTPWSSKSPSSPQKPLPSNLADDELFALDISSALFPSGLNNNAFSPSDYKNLQQTSLALLTKFQLAYQSRTRQFLELRSETEAEREEAEETETRVRSLRSQLQDMASKFSVQEEMIGNLVTELAEEKRARAEEREAREKSIQLVKERAERASKHTSASSTSSLGLGLEGGIEDLGIRSAQRGKWGHGSLDLSSAGDSDAESLNADSVFSRSRSPTLTVSSTGPSASGTVDSTPEIGQASFTRLVSIPNPALPSSNTSTPRPPKFQQKSTFQKILTGLSPGSSSGEMERGCENCRGKDSSVAWDTVGLLRAENKGLKERVGTLEGAVEGALDLCSGLHVA
ncbi:hypothetical protein BGZ57DRAFT_760343 [Hyaloscypha finlandica]|nr:hypothetical protein BGZ57DRAFT_760343 [Hyaloscypha finlandica]